MKKTGTLSLRALCALAGTALLPAIALAQPANDNCGSAATASLGANAGDSTLATQDAPSPTCGFDTSFTEDVWFAFTPGTTGFYQFDTEGSVILDDTVVSVYTGACGALTEIACDDDGGTGLLSNVTVSLTGGTTYRIRVAGYENSEGAFTLNIASVTPSNDICAAATALSVGVSVAGDNSTYGTDGDSPSCTFVDAGDAWYSFTPTAVTPRSYRVTVTPGDLVNDPTLSVHTSCAQTDELLCADLGVGGDPETGLFAGSPGVTYLIRVAGYFGDTGPFDIIVEDNGSLIANDLCTGATPVSLMTPVADDNTGATLDGDIPLCSVGDTADLWYSFTAPGVTPRVYQVTMAATSATIDGILSVHDDCAQTNTLDCADDTFDGANEVCVFTGNPGVTYLIRAAAYVVGPATGSYTIEVLDIGAPLANDTCANAIAFDTMTPGTGDTTNATGEGVNASCSLSSKDQWFTFTAPAAGFYQFSCDGAGGTILSIFASCGGAELSCAGATAGTIANAAVNLTNGQIVKVRVTGFADAATPFTLSVAPIPAPPNDTCDFAEVVSLNGSASPVIIAAGDDADVGCNQAANTSLRSAVWYSVTPATDGILFLNETSGADVAFALYTGTCGSLTEVGCSEAEPSSFAVTGGQAYFVAVGLWSATTAAPVAPLALTFELVTPPDNDDCESATALTTSPVTSDGRGATDDINVAPACDAGTAGANNGVWYTYTTGADAGVLSLTEGSANDVILAVYSGAGCGSLTEVTCSDAETDIDTTLAANTTYFVLVAMWGSTSTPSAPYSLAFTFTADTGACCQSGGVCSVTTNSGCTTLSGTWQGSGVACFGAATATGSEFASTDSFPIAIPDDTIPGITASVTISGSGVTIGAGGIAVNVGLAHTFAGDVAASISNGTFTAELVNTVNDADSSNFAGVYTFIDGAADMWPVADTLDTDTVIPPGSYRASDIAGAAVGLGSAFAGQPLDGTWTLTVSDVDLAITGSLTSFSIQNATPGAPTCPTGPTPCEQADFDDSGSVSVNDLFAFLAAWFAQNNTSGMGLSADIDGNDAVSVNDLFAFLALWFQFNNTTC